MRIRSTIRAAAVFGAAAALTAGCLSSGGGGRVTDNGGNTVEFAYDSRNNRVLTVDAARGGFGASGNRSRAAFDGLDRLIADCRMPIAELKAPPETSSR